MPHKVKTYLVVVERKGADRHIRVVGPDKRAAADAARNLFANMCRDEAHRTALARALGASWLESDSRWWKMTALGEVVVEISQKDVWVELC